MHRCAVNTKREFVFLIFEFLFIMGCIYSIFKRKNIISNDQVVDFLENLHEQIVVLSMHDLTNSNYKLKHIRSLIILYKQG